MPKPGLSPFVGSQVKIKVNDKYNRIHLMKRWPLLSHDRYFMGNRRVCVVFAWDLELPSHNGFVIDPNVYIHSFNADGINVGSKRGHIW